LNVQLNPSSEQLSVNQKMRMNCPDAPKHHFCNRADSADGEPTLSHQTTAKEIKHVAGTMTSANGSQPLSEC
jgi:hypothetical protein